MLTPDFKAIVERPLVRRDGGTGDVRNVMIRIGAPAWDQGRTEGICRIEIVGALANRVELRGIDPFQALELALRFVNTYLSSKTGKISFTWPSGEPYEPTA